MYKLRSELRAHSADVRGVAVSPDGVIATVSRDNSIGLWDPGAVEPRTLLQAHTHFVNAATFVATGKLVTASSDKTLRVWDVKTAQCISTLNGHTAPVCAVTELPVSEGELVASASWDQTARVWDLASATCIRVLTGHQAAVWSVAGLSDGRIVTVAADKTVRVWPAGSTESATLSAAHTDVVRDVMPGPRNGIITVANDSALVYWAVQGSSFGELRRVSDLHDGSYIYSVDGRETSPNKWTFVTGGEDNAVRVVEADLASAASINCVQTVMHPGTVWGVCLCPNGDFVSACSDGVARVFTMDPGVTADPDVLASFEKAVSERQVNTKVIGGVDVNKLPEVEAALAVPGKKDGENKIVKTAGGKAEVYMWSAGEQKWSKVGEVVDNPGAGASGGMVNGKTYDFVFEVELGEGGKKEKLGYNRGENPYLAAQRFIDDNELNQEFLEQIAQFIEQQVPPDALQARNTVPSDPLTGGSRYVPGGGRQTTSSQGDPLTGGSRYVPGGTRQTSSNQGDPLTGASRYVPTGSAAPPDKLPPPRKLIPHANGIVLYKSSDQLEKIQMKLSEFNTAYAKEGSSLALSQSEAEVFGGSLLPKLKRRGGGSVILEDGDCAVVEKLLQWPTTHAFPVLDITRLVISLPSGCAFFFGSRNGAVLDEVLSHMTSSDASAPVHIMGCRFLCNMFGSRISGEVARGRCESILTSAAASGKSSNRRARETYASLLINYAVMFHDSKAQASERSAVIEAAVGLISGGEEDEEVLYRLMIAIGTAICDDVESARKGVELGVAQAASDTAPKSARLQQVALEIATIIAS